VTKLIESHVDHGSGQIGEAHPTTPGFITPERDPNLVFETGEAILDMMRRA
jgi:hypothetical protein